MTKKELKRWKEELCHELDLPADEVVLTVVLDFFICPMSEKGCAVSYEAGDPGRYHILVSKNMTNSKAALISTIKEQLQCYE